MCVCARARNPSMSIASISILQVMKPCKLTANGHSTPFFHRFVVYTDSTYFCSVCTHLRRAAHVLVCKSLRMVTFFFDIGALIAVQHRESGAFKRWIQSGFVANLWPMRISSRSTTARGRPEQWHFYEKPGLACHGRRTMERPTVVYGVERCRVVASGIEVEGRWKPLPANFLFEDLPPITTLKAVHPWPPPPPHLPPSWWKKVSLPPRNVSGDWPVQR